MKNTVILFIGLFITMNCIAQSQEFLKWAEKPPMGWNSYDCFGAAVNEEEIRDNAKMVETHLKKCGWEYIVIDYMWYYPRVGALNNPPQDEDFEPGMSMDKFGRLLPDPERFPSSVKGKGFKLVGKDIHERGLKFGIHIMRGIPREAVAKKLPVKGTQYTADQIADTSSICKWSNAMYGIDMNKPGAQEYYNSLFEMYASWGVDFVKVDDIASPYSPKEVEAIRKAIDRTGRKIILSLSPGNNTPIEMAQHLKDNANMWRITKDFWDEWDALKRNFERVKLWEDHIGPGHFPDADMIPFGLLNLRGPGDGLPRRSNFTDVEKYTLMTLWAIARSPLMYGGDLRNMRPVELKLLTNREVLAVNQNSSNNRQLFREGDKVAWIADVPGANGKYLALFNLGEEDTSFEIDLKDMGFKGNIQVRELWNKKDMGTRSNKFTFQLKPHASALFKLSLPAN